MADIIDKVTARSDYRARLAARKASPENHAWNQGDPVGIGNRDPDGRGVVAGRTDMNIGGTKNGFNGFIHNTVGVASKAINELTHSIQSSEGGRTATWVLSKLWRAKIAINRTVLVAPRVKDTYAARDIKSTLAKAQNQHEAKKSSLSLAEATDLWQTNRRAAMISGADPSHFKIPDNKFGKGIGDLKSALEPYRYEVTLIKWGLPLVTLHLQNRPTELNFSSESTWAAIQSMGRNNPFRMYTSGDDTISFDISWYTTGYGDENRDQVLNKCKLLESWTKADGYNAAPPTLAIVWGDTGMFDGESFILESAPYRLFNFQERGMSAAERAKLHKGQQATFKDWKLFPMCATQTLTFKRVTSTNRTHQDIITLDKLQKTLGIILSPSDSSTVDLKSDDTLPELPSITPGALSSGGGLATR